MKQSLGITDLFVSLNLMKIENLLIIDRSLSHASLYPQHSEGSEGPDVGTE